MDKSSIFDFENYKEYLVATLGSEKQRRGLKSKASKAIQCQPTFISLVLHGNAHFSLEQADRFSEFMGHTLEEKRFFFLMVQKGRAGTRSLSQFFQTQMNEILTRRQSVMTRFEKVHELEDSLKSKYYRSWLYAAIHMAVTIPGLQSIEALCEKFKLNQKKMSEILEFLSYCGLVKIDPSGWIPAEKKIRIGAESDNLISHLWNWRNQAIGSLENDNPEDYHYSGVYSVSKKDVLKLKELLLKQLEEVVSVVDISKEEELVCFNVDLFNIKK